MATPANRYGQLGYAAGNPFGDPAGFTASTGGAEIDRFNQWLRSQPWWADAKAQGPDAVAKAMQDRGIPISEDMQIDDAGNLHTKSWTERHPTLTKALEVGAIGAGAAFGAPALLGAFGVGGGAAGAGAAELAGETGAEVAGEAGAAGLGAAEAGAGLGAEVAGEAGAAGAAGTAAAEAGAAGAAGTAGAAAAGSAPSWLGPIVGKGLEVGGGLVGAGMQASAARHAADVNKQYLDEALAYQKEQDAYKRRTEANRYGQTMAGLSPYASEGANANTALAGFLGLPSPGTASTPTPMSSNLVTMQAPDGSTKQVPASEMQHWIDRGATMTGATPAPTSPAAAGPTPQIPANALAHYAATRPMPPMR